jgi:hypothetical protein
MALPVALPDTLPLEAEPLSSSSSLLVEIGSWKGGTTCEVDEGIEVEGIVATVALLRGVGPEEKAGKTGPLPHDNPLDDLLPLCPLPCPWSNGIATRCTPGLSILHRCLKDDRLKVLRDIGMEEDPGPNAEGGNPLLSFVE